MKKGPIIVLDISKHAFRMVEGRGVRGGAEIARFLVKEISLDDPARLNKVISELLPAKEIEEENLVVLIPRRETFVKQLILPSHDAAELRRMVALQCVNLVPYQRDDILYDIHVVEHMPDGNSRILAVLASRAVVFHRLDVLRQAGLTPAYVTTSSFGLLGWYEQKSQAQGWSMDFCAVIYLADEGSEIVFCHGDRLLYSRFLKFSTEDALTGHRKEFLDQVGLTFGVYQGEHMGESISRILLISSLTEVSDLQNELHETYSVPVDVFLPEDGVAWEKSAAVDAKTLSVVTPMSGALHESIVANLNLIPDEVLHSKASKKRQRVYIQFAVALILAVSLAVMAMAIDIFTDNAHLASLKKQIEAQQALMTNADKKIQFLEFAREEIKSRVLVVDIVKAMIELTPEDMSFRVINLDREGIMVLQGYAQDGGSVNNFQRNLVNSTLFEDVNLQYATKRKRFREEYTDFKIICRVSKKEEAGT